MGLLGRLRRHTPGRSGSTGPAAPAVEVRLVVGGEEEAVPVESRIRSIRPDRWGLYPHEILMLSYAPSCSSTGQQFEGFWRYRYGVADPGAVLTSLAGRGFLGLGGVEQAAGRQTAATLKKVLAEHGLRVSGKKAELVARVLDSVPPDELSRRFPERLYVLTETGQAALEAGGHIPYIHRHPDLDGLDIFSLTELLDAHPGRPYRDVIWGHLNEQSLRHAQASDWGLYRNTRFGMAQFLAEEGKFREALALMAEVEYYDLSGMGNGFRMEHLPVHAEYLFPYERSLAKSAPGIIDLIFDWADQAGLSDDELRDLLLERLRLLDSPLRLFTAEECAKVVFLERDRDTPALTALYARAEPRFRVTYRL
jgi:SAP domain